MKVRWVYRSRIAQVLNVDAIVLYPFVLTRRERNKVSAALVAHETMHVQQVRRLGIPRFYVTYVLYYLSGLWKHRSHFQAYLAIPYEVEAREAEKVQR